MVLPIPILDLAMDYYHRGYMSCKSKLMLPPSPKQAIIRIVWLLGLKKPPTSGLLFLSTSPSTSAHPQAESERFLRDCLHSRPQSPFCRWRKENLPYPQPPLSQMVSAK